MKIPASCLLELTKAVVISQFELSFSLNDNHLNVFYSFPEYRIQGCLIITDKLYIGCSLNTQIFFICCFNHISANVSIIALYSTSNEPSNMLPCTFPRYQNFLSKEHYPYVGPTTSQIKPNCAGLGLEFGSIEF